MVNVAIVGCGVYGKVHAKAVKQIDEANVIAAVDTKIDKGKVFADEIGARFYADYDQVLSDKDVDIVAICTPNFLHSEMAIKAAHAKKHVFCEKPLAISLDQADRMIEAVKANRVKAIVGHVLRFWSAYARVKQIIEGNELSHPLYGYFERIMPIPSRVEESWNLKENAGGGVALELEIHEADYVHWLFGKPVLVRSKSFNKPPNNVSTHLVSDIEFEKGQSVLIQVGWEFSPSFPFTNVLRIVCEKGIIEWVYRVGFDFWYAGEINPLAIYKTDGSRRVEEVEQIDPFLTEWKYFIGCILNDKKIENSSFEDGREALRLVLATIESARDDSPLSL